MTEPSTPEPALVTTPESRVAARAERPGSPSAQATSPDDAARSAPDLPTWPSTTGLAKPQQTARTAEPPTAEPPAAPLTAEPPGGSANEPVAGTPAADGSPTATTAPPPPPAGPAVRRPHRRAHTVRRRIALVLLVLALGAAAAAAVYLYRTTEAWEARSEDYLTVSQGLGEELAASRAELAGTQAELDAVRSQLATARARIVELADEKAQLGDDREVQQQIVDYQERVTEAAGRVALALDQCVQGQNQLIGYLQNAEQYDPVELERYGTDVQAVCQTATEANTALQRELAR